MNTVRAVQHAADVLFSNKAEAGQTLLCCVIFFFFRPMMVLFVYSGVGSLGSSHWELQGDAMVTTDQVRLTPDMQSRQGAVWSRIVSIHMRW